MLVLGSGHLEDVVVAGSWNDPKRFWFWRRVEQFPSQLERNRSVPIPVDEKLRRANPAYLWKRVVAADEQRSDERNQGPSNITRRTERSFQNQPRARTPR